MAVQEKDLLFDFEDLAIDESILPAASSGVTGASGKEAASQSLQDDEEDPAAVK